MRSVSVSAALLTSAGLVGLASADPLIDNLNQPSAATSILGTVDPDILWAAQSFGTPSPRTLDSIETLLGLAIDGVVVVAELRSGLDPSGPLLATFAVPPLSETSVELVTLIPDSVVTLQPNELYWLVLGPAAVGSFGWTYAAGNGYSGPGFFGDYAYSSDFGGTWGAFGNEDPYQMRVNVTSSCIVDHTGSSDPNDPAYGVPDGAVDASDFFYFLDQFAAGNLAVADLSGSSDPNDPAYGVPDGAIDASDFFYFLDLFVAGCP